jgi:hypothetical protein
MCQNIEGKAYLHMSMDGTKFVDVASEKNGMRQARALSYGLQVNDMDTRETLRANLGRFIVDSRTPASSVSSYFKAVHDQVLEQNQVIEILYKMLELQEVAPGVKKPRYEWTKKSSSSNFEYELWSDGQLYYRAPHGGMRQFSLSGLSPLNSGDSRFAHKDWVRPEDLRVTGATFPEKKTFSRENPPNPVLYMEGGQNNDRFVFELDEHNNTLTLLEKNGSSVSPQYYRRDSSSDGVAADGRYAGPAVLRRSKK